MTCRDFAKDNQLFIKACALAEIPVTKRQASKFLRKKGRAWVERNRAQAALDETQNEKSN